jgi:hypothetical protein
MAKTPITEPARNMNRRRCSARRSAARNAAERSRAVWVRGFAAFVRCEEPLRGVALPRGDLLRCGPRLAIERYLRRLLLTVPTLRRELSGLFCVLSRRNRLGPLDSTAALKTPLPGADQWMLAASITNR